MATLCLLASNPDIQKRAQAEIDQVIGLGRLPDFDDRDQLVYLSAILKEVARLYQIAPLGMSERNSRSISPPTRRAGIQQFVLGLAHAALEDDVYDGYFIPKGTIMIGNSW